MLDKLDRAMRLRLLRVLAAAAWVDGEVQESERAFMVKLISKLPLGEDERELVLGYLDTPPHPAEADPSKIPPDYREGLMNLVREVISADGKIDEEEERTVKELEELLLG